MVYRGPSKGCQTCRKRRVRCDEARPACSNCIKRGSVCPGYPQVFKPGEKFIDETETVKEQSEKDKLPLVRREPEEDQVPVKLLNDDELFTSMCFFINNYVLVDRGIQSIRGKLRSIPDFYMNSKKDSAVSSAISSLTLSFHSMWRAKGPDSMLSRHYVNRALLSLQDELNDPTQSHSDEVLFAILMLHFREHILGLAKMNDGSNDHTNGAYAVIKHRGRHTFQSVLSKQMVQDLRNAAALDALKSKTAIDLDVPVWQIHGDMPADPSDELSWLAIDIAKLQADFQQFKTKSSLLQSNLNADTTALIDTMMSFRESAYRCEQELLLWADCQKRTFRPLSLSIEDVSTSVRKAGIYHDLCQVYPSIKIAGVWHLQRFMRLILLKIMMSCNYAIQKLQTSKLESEQEFLSTMSLAQETQIFQQLIDDLCAAVPFHVGNRTGEGYISDFDDQKVVFPWPPPERDPWLSPSDSEAGFGSEQDLPMTIDEHRREALAVGGWHLLSPLWNALNLLEEPFSLFPENDGVRNFGSLISDGQITWMWMQFRRILVLQRMLSRPGLLKR